MLPYKLSNSHFSHDLQKIRMFHLQSTVFRKVGFVFSKDTIFLCPQVKPFHVCDSANLAEAFRIFSHLLIP